VRLDFLMPNPVVDDRRVRPIEALRGACLIAEGARTLRLPACFPAKRSRARGLDFHPYFCNYRNMPSAISKKNLEQVARYADMFSAMGTEPRLRIMQLLLQAHPEGLVVGEIQAELEIPNSTLSHHLDKLRSEELVRVTRESTFLRYTANTEALQELLGFLYAECCTRNKAVPPLVSIRSRAG
jgi:ArsR family transcriptional regulator, arsenate/arsenite/antimonite-responsive transcriptional repressor